MALVRAAPCPPGTAPMALPAPAPRMKSRLEVSARDCAQAAPGKNFSFIPGAEDEEELGCSQNILCQPRVPRHHCLSVPPLGAV